MPRITPACVSRATDEANVFGLFQPMEGRDAGMVQRSENARFALEPGE